MNMNLEKLAGEDIHYFDTVDSTNLALRRLAETGAPPFSTVLAEEQLAGRGRLGRNWFSPPASGLWFSILLRPQGLKAAAASGLTLATAAVIAAEVNRTLALPLKVKWPNDLVLEEKKAGGILTELVGSEAGVDFIIVGIGINTGQKEGDFPPELRAGSISLAMAVGRPIDRAALFLALREQLITAYGRFFAGGFSPFRLLWISHNSTLGRTVKLSGPGEKLEGMAVDLSAKGELVLEDKSGKRHSVASGEIYY